MPTDKRFTGQMAQAAGYVGSLYDYSARFYSPALGRFVSADTIVPGAGNSGALNRYMYVSGNPLRMVDPSGHFWREAVIVFGAAMLGAGIGLAAKSLEQATYEGMQWYAGYKSMDVALTDINSKENQASRIGAAAGGATSGAIIGVLALSKAGAASETLGLSAASVAGGQVEALVGGIAEESMIQGSAASLADASVRASGRGFLSPGKVALDAGAGILAGFASKVAEAAIGKSIVNAARPVVKEIVGFEPYNMSIVLVNSLGRSNVVNLNPLQQLFVAGMKVAGNIGIELLKRKSTDVP